MPRSWREWFFFFVVFLVLGFLFVCEGEASKVQYVRSPAFFFVFFLLLKIIGFVFVFGGGRSQQSMYLYAVLNFFSFFFCF